MNTTIAAYGTWNSPITPATLTANAVRLGEAQLCNDVAYWLESRPDEGGRNVLMYQQIGDTARELLDANTSVRSRANEYGGGAYLATTDAVYAVFDADQRVYQIPLKPAAVKQDNAAAPIALTPKGDYRYADFCLDAKRARLIAVREDHSGVATSHSEPKCELVAIDLSGNLNVQVLVSGADFYSNPRLSHSGEQLLWLSWQHPSMPWDATTLTLATLNAKGATQNLRVIAGGDGESVFQPQWSPTDHIYYVSDRSNWWNLYRHDDAGAVPVVAMEAEFATPQWVFGMSTYGFCGNRKIFCTFSQNGEWQLGLISIDDTHTAYHFSALKNPMSDISSIASSANHLLFIGANAQQAPALFHVSTQAVEHSGTPPVTLIRRSQEAKIEPGYLARPQAISYPSGSGVCHGFYYPPCNRDFSAPAHTLPPLIIICHGGPTGATSSALNYKLQFWSSRGFAVLDVNYRGSTGYGRAYRDSLKFNWGIKDVEDVVAGANFLVAQKLTHPEQLIIRGSSAGGYTVLAALTFSDTFSAGASLYGIGDLTALAEDTHKFESRYLDSLVGPYPATKQRYLDRSPIQHIEQLNCPVIFLQGLKDKMVPPAQAEAMVAALTDKGIANQYVTFANEGHGFRAADSIQTAISKELDFYCQTLQLHKAQR
ncbi:dipeptidyl-peptidase 5 [Gilvimarinus polysaccharolyticus]|uniref:dipeptidyl-peptidase 5 n=1 Tax=Gilvimarinus polysaccharolyticus TaxID=863921 RepID=UPI0006737925|nr:prolyl oligopeptidase family serine peptidase [Gilvimarinus polysaccharolyticus]